MALPNAYRDLNALSMQPVPNGAPEYYIELWWYSGSFAQNTASSSGVNWIAKGQTGAATISTQPYTTLHTLNANWNPNQKYAFEACLAAAVSSITVYAALWDLTSGTVVSASQISATNTGTTMSSPIRSGQFTLTPGHKYGITGWSSSGQAMELTDASLIVFS
jgi:hypothetical protein